jgi:CRISPR system Cascade subunit CasB
MADAPPATAADASRQERDPNLRSYDEFVAGVRAVCRDAGAQQALRRALAKPVEEVPARTHAVLLRGGLIKHGGEDVKGSRRRRAWYAVAALIAARPRAEREADKADAEPEEDAVAPAAGLDPHGTTLGGSLAQAVTRRRDGGDGIKENGAESRLHLAVRQDTDGIHRMLPGLARQIGGAGVALDYGQLLRDLDRWEFSRDRVVTRWLEDYYRTLRRAEAAAKNAKKKGEGTTPDA